jgi:palmitoyltransferase
MAYSVASSGHREAKVVYAGDDEMKNHVEAVWLGLMTLLFLFAIFTGILTGYHTYLILSGQTTWEHSSRTAITYLEPYKPGQMPFFLGICGNIKQTFFHGGKPKKWVLLQPAELKETQGFNICDNEYYSCC